MSHAFPGVVSARMGKKRRFFERKYDLACFAG